MIPLAKLRAAVDSFNKTYANNPLLTTGGEGRVGMEAMNTGAIARMHGNQRQIPKDIGTVPLSKLVKK